MEPQKVRRFQIVRLEERIAPARFCGWGGSNRGSHKGSHKGSKKGSHRGRSHGSHGRSHGSHGSNRGCRPCVNK